MGGNNLHDMAWDKGAYSLIIKKKPANKDFHYQLLDLRNRFLCLIGSEPVGAWFGY